MVVWSVRGDTSTRELQEGTQATLPTTIKNVWITALFLFHSYHLGCREFSQVWLLLRFRPPGCAVGAWLIKVGESEGERENLQLTVTGTLAEKRTVLSRSCRRPHCKATSDVNLNLPSSLGILLKVLLHLLPHPQARERLSRIRSACRSKCLPVLWQLLHSTLFNFKI